MNSDIVRRKAERKAFCRGCDEKIEKGQEIVFTHSWRNRGQNILFCIECAKKVGELANE